MKKLLLLMTLMMPLLFSSCGDDKGDPDFFSKQLIGEWVEVNGPEDELFHIKFDSTHKGLIWITDNQVTILEAPFTWTENGGLIVIKITEDGKTTKGTGEIRDGFLYIYGNSGDESDYILYTKVK